MTPGWVRWYVVSTKPRKEDLVSVLLEQAGLPTFQPRVLEWCADRRTTRARVNLLFPGYLFVRMSAARHHARVRWTPGVRRVLGGDDLPAPVDDILVETLAARMGERGYVVQRPDLRPGDRVVVRAGPFRGLFGVVEGPSTARERVRVLLSLFERETAVELEGRTLARLGFRCRT